MFNPVKLSGIAAATLFLTACASTPELTSDQISIIEAEVVEYGLYEIGKTREVDNDSYIAGSSLVTKSHKLIKTTNQIKSEVGSIFGVMFKITGLPERRKIQFREVMKFPEMTDPDSGITQSYYESTKFFKNEMSRFKGFTFEYDWELVKGDWTYQIYYQDTLLAEQTFIVN